MVYTVYPRRFFDLDIACFLLELVAGGTSDPTQYSVLLFKVLEDSISACQPVNHIS